MQFHPLPGAILGDSTFNPHKPYGLHWAEVYIQNKICKYVSPTKSGFNLPRQRLSLQDRHPNNSISLCGCLKPGMLRLCLYNNTPSNLEPTHRSHPSESFCDLSHPISSRPLWATQYQQVPSCQKAHVPTRILQGKKFTHGPRAKHSDSKSTKHYKKKKDYWMNDSRKEGPQKIMRRKEGGSRQEEKEEGQEEGE